MYTQTHAHISIISRRSDKENNILTSENTQYAIISQLNVIVFMNVIISHYHRPVILWYDRDKIATEVIFAANLSENHTSNISKIGQNRTWGNMIICMNNNVCSCLYVNTWEHNDEALTWANNVILHSFLELDNIITR